MTATVVDDFDRRWAEWRARGQRRNALLSRRALWFVVPMGTALLLRVAWALM